MAEVQKSAWDFIFGGCRLVEVSEKFAAIWLDTKGDPCSICGKDKPLCSFYRKLTDGGVIVKKDSSP